MKKLLVILSAVGIVWMGCNSKQPDKQTAFDTIKKGLAYPRTLDRDIYCSDPEHARKLQAAGLEKEGLITIQRTQKAGDAGKPLIRFMAKAQPCLLITPEKDKAIGIQKVKVAEEDMAGIVSIQHDENTKTEIVEYTTVYKNVTPFAALVNQDFTTPKKHKAYLSLQDGDWQIEKSKMH